jgi:hypothetical protein
MNLFSIDQQATGTSHLGHEGFFARQSRSSLPSILSHSPPSPPSPPPSSSALLGDLYLAINQETESIRLFRESLSIYQRLKVLKDQAGLGGGGGDKRALLSIQSSLARALCSGPDTDEGMELFRVTIAEEAAHVGPFHHNLLIKYFNAGVCAAAKGLIVEAIENMNSCLKTCEANPHIPKDGTCGRAQGYLSDLQRRRRFAPTEDL